MLTLSTIEGIEGEEGNFTVSVKKSPRYVDLDKCIACGACAEKCPAKTSDEFNEGLAKRKAIYLPYPQAVPLKYAIDADRCIYFKKGKCKACEKFCPTDAIRFDETEEILKINVGSVIVAGGFKPFDPSGLDNYQHHAFPNVVTSLEFERILAAGGPTGGHVLRPSDGQEAKRIAWLQCVGSRDMNRCDNEYCSSVCCMYAIKESVIAKEHIGDSFEPTIFYIDMRTHGKDFEKYYERAKDQGTRFIRSRVHTVQEADDSGTLKLAYVSESGEIENETFDMLVLSVGMEPADSVADLAGRLGIELDRFNFVKTEDIAPVSTSRPGIYAAGVIRGCKDIPQSVVEAGAAACAAGMKLAPARGEMTSAKRFPDETDVAGEEPRLGVFVCNCGVNIGGVVDVPGVVEYAKSLPGVEYVEESLFTCSQDTQEKMAEAIRENRLNRVVVAACTPRTHEPLFQETIRNAGLNPYLFEMANIRNQCAWVHSDEKEKATQKARDLVRMGVARAGVLEPIPDLSVEVKKSALVAGGGVAGMTAALSLAEQGFKTTIVEKEAVLGGAARDVKKTWKSADVQAFLKDMIERVEKHPDIDTLLSAAITGASGFVGNYVTDVSVDGTPASIEHGVAIMATGGHSSSPDEYLLGKDPRVSVWHDLENDPGRLKGADSVVFIQCVGSREEGHPYCSGICCTASVSMAIDIKDENPDAQVYILYRDIRTFGERELIYKEAREKGVLFIRYTPEKKPEVREENGDLMVRVHDPVIGRDLDIKADLINLATAIEPHDNQELASFYKLPVNEENFFMEAHAKLKPVEFASDGLFMCGLAHYPKSIDDSVAQAMAAASRAAAVLARDSIDISPLVSKADAEKCVGCGLCEEICAFGAIVLEETDGAGSRAKNIPASCKGCGLCAASCPKQAIDMLHFRDAQIEASILAV
ncbi:Heterodisulfide reductase [Candidatus Desulfarcum epimagneticum]|uniref:Heterodisulfide reductase n=1 Tax=uncultured Desulfobacteraceae bacterium TaxID=218296 RepID=A0A484HJ67_9BACT|nr:Heterodisulfide reductase [uncultured Desulfobacteraceae bacterium]